MATEIAHVAYDTLQQPTLAEAVLATVAYADVFDYPLTVEELHRYLIGVSASIGQVDAMVDHPDLRGQLERRRGYVMLAGREAALAKRERRAHIAARMWPRAFYYGRILARLPFVRMVAVTGALAVDNVEPGADIDYLVITEPGRLWVCRMLAIALVRVAKLRGDIICPNYFLADTALALDTQSLYAAHELTQMVPLAGSATYQHMRAVNSWALQYLPNAADAPERSVRAERVPGRTRTMAERMLRSSVGAQIERWEMERKIRKFAQQGGNPETAFSPEWCKGHFDGHGRRVMAAYHERLRALGPSLSERTA